MGSTIESTISIILKTFGVHVIIFRIAYIPFNYVVDLVLFILKLYNRTRKLNDVFFSENLRKKTLISRR